MTKETDSVSGELEITPQMIEAGVRYFEIATEDRFPPNWANADLFVRGMLKAVMTAGAVPYKCR